MKRLSEATVLLLGIPGLKPGVSPQYQLSELRRVFYWLLSAG